MQTVQNTDTRLPETVAEIRAAALTALDAWAVRDRQEAADLLLFWNRRAELTAEDEVAVLDAVFPDVTRPTAAMLQWGSGFAEGFLAGMQAAHRTQRAAACALATEAGR